MKWDSSPMALGDLVLVNGNVITMAEPNRTAQAISIREGTIVEVGSNSAATKRLGGATRVVDLAGRTVVPGFIDAHNHMMLYGLSLSDVDCRAPPITSIAEMVRRIGESAKERRRGTWIKAFGYSQFAVKEKRHPTRGELDEATGEHPVILQHFSFHAAVLNSAALARCRIDRNTPDPPGGRIERDPKTDEPTGLLIERAQSLADRALPALTPAAMGRAIELASKDFVKSGITTVQDPGWIFHETSHYLDAYTRAEKDGTLLVRVGVMINGDRLDGFLLDGGAPSADGSTVRLGPVKMFADGVVNLRTAAMTEPYSDLPHQHGFLVTSEEELIEKVARANRAGLQVAIHAIGDGAIDTALNAFEASRRRAPGLKLRPRLIHAVVLRPDQIARIKRLGAVVDAQPIFLRALGNQFSLAVGPRRSSMILPFRTLLNHGISVCGGSDAPCTDLSPLTGISECAGRLTPSGGVEQIAERVSVEDGLRMYTSLAAYNCGEEAVKGSVEPGKWGDLTVLSGNPLTSEVERISRISVEMTIVGGRVVYERDGDRGGAA